MVAAVSRGDSVPEEEGGYTEQEDLEMELD